MCFKFHGFIRVCLGTDTSSITDISYYASQYFKIKIAANSINYIPFTAVLVIKIPYFHLHNRHCGLYTYSFVLILRILQTQQMLDYKEFRILLLQSMILLLIPFTSRPSSFINATIHWYSSFDLI